MSGIVEGKVAIVTGAGRGLGAGMAMDLAAQGAKVAVVDINKAGAEQIAEDIRHSGGTAIAMGADVSDRSAVKAMISDVVGKFGRLDVMFNNAGISQTCPFLEVTEADFNRIIKINTLGVLIGTQEAAKQFISQGNGGKVINTASIAGKQGWPDYAHYCASKFGVVSITQSAARALAAHKITVNCFSPGVVATELWKDLDEDARHYGVTEKPDDLINSFTQNILLGRAAQPADLVGVTTFLASDKASYITGQTIMVDGGMVLI
ncbi:SDR family NAD(P)-dependent oxidoreductase [Solirhodobacter olei]|uniref:SDR family NAD(P)-dependent oxidoreductase n=1 Tax=Solirhodobacter olei TaxID=2493082 RepID=UPI000FD826FA|nr:glucose 1-dehydrogenase [Solirhodobacter olei]